MGEPIKQIRLSSYPQVNDRMFKHKWYDLFNWLMYSPLKNAAFCYPCMQFQPNSSKEVAYIKTGFNIWRKALDNNNQGSRKPEASQTHIVAMSLWKEKRREKR